MNSLILLQSLPGAVNKAVDEVSISRIDMLLDKLLALSLTAGKRILVAVLIYIAGRFVIKIINRVVSAMLSRRHVDVGVQSFLRSLVHILLTILLIISVISALGINTTSFAALLASAGVAVGMALSGNLQNFAGGLVILGQKGRNLPAVPRHAIKKDSLFPAARTRTEIVMQFFDPS